jgi:isoquinoline 1-oxidoreductase alpha subunit
MELNINGQRYTIADEPARPLLYVLRDELGLTGTKFGCGAGICGACTVHVNGKATRSCQTMVTTLAVHMNGTGNYIQYNRPFSNFRFPNVAGV